MSSRLLTTAASTRRLHRMDDGARQTTRPRKRLTGIARPAPADAPAAAWTALALAVSGFASADPAGAVFPGAKNED